MAQHELSVGDRVKINDRSTTHPGATGTVSFVSGSQYWIRLDGGEVVASLHRWMLDPA